MAVTTQMVAALVRPVTLPRMVEDGPRADEADAGEDLGRDAPGVAADHPPCGSESSVKRSAPMQMRMLVRRPAGLSFSSRSKPMAPPSTHGERRARPAARGAARGRGRPSGAAPSPRASRCPRRRAAAGPLGERRLDVVAVHAGDELDADLLRAGRLALVVVGAGAEALRVHLRRPC